MVTEQLIEEAQKLTNEIILPNQPQVIQELDKELNKKNADFRSISNLIGKDVTLTAKVIKIANAPFWGNKRKVDSIERALFILGLKNFKNIVLTTCMRETFQTDTLTNEQFEAFHKHSMKVAVIARFFADHIAFEENYKIDKDQAYLTGLFHDCGMMLMSKKFDDYLDNSIVAISREQNLNKMEQNNYKMNHAMVSCMLISKWHLPQLLIEPVLYHHDSSIERHKNKYIKQMSAILKMAEHFVSYIPSSNKNDVLFNTFIQNTIDLEEIKAFMNIDDEEFKFYQVKISDLADGFCL